MAAATITSNKKIDNISAVAKDSHNPDGAFNLHRQVWGGEHRHLGIYDTFKGEDENLKGLDRIVKANKLATFKMLSLCFPREGPPSNTCTMVDMGSGCGGTAREAARQRGCKVICVNMSRRENERATELNKAEGLENKITIPGELSFLDTGLRDAAFDVVVSQDSFLHAGADRDKCLLEASRILKPGGIMVFSDIMIKEDAAKVNVEKVPASIHVNDMATLSAYKSWGEKAGLEFVDFRDASPNVSMHYHLIKEVLHSRREDLEHTDKQFFDNMTERVDAWISAVEGDLLRWGCMVFKKPTK